jgi:Zn-dependent protease with chaperone function
MRFRQHQATAQAQTLRLFGWFAVLLVVLTLAVNLLLALAYRVLMPLGLGYPALFFETNTAVVLLFVLGGCLVETQRLRSGGGPRIAHWLSGRELTSPDSSLERRLLNVVDEMALASGQAVPRVYVLHREDAINAFVAGWLPHDTVMCVTQGALDRLNRAELQGLVAHEFGHIKEGDLPMTMRLLALVWGLSLVHGYGQSLMSADEDGRVSPGSWLIGLVFSGVGWLGWLTGRALQAAVSRQREFLADASAIQFTRSRDGLGNVLRKLWHDQQVLAGRMRHPAADMVASLLLHQPGASSCLSSHPRLSERIRRVCGSVLPPIPAPLLRPQDNEPRRSPPRQPNEAIADFAAPFVAQSETGVPLTIHLGDQEALSRLHRLSGPKERRLAVLALMMDPSNQCERKLWERMAEGLTLSRQILADVLSLHAKHRIPEFERQASAIAAEPIEVRRALVENARDLLKADGRVSPSDRLWWLALRRRVSEQHGKATLRRPTAGQGHTLLQLDVAAQQPVAALTAYLARFVPVAESGQTRHSTNQAWLSAVYRRCGMTNARALETPPPDADSLMIALAEVQELSWMMRPMLLKAWVEEAVNHSPQGMLSDSTADALRLAAALIDSPLPPILEAHYAQT